MWSPTQHLLQVVAIAKAHKTLVGFDVSTGYNQTMLKSFCLVLVSLLLSASVSAADTDALRSALTGDFEQIETPAQITKRAHASVEQILDQVPWFAKSFARNKLQAQARACSKYRIEWRESVVFLSCDNRESLECKPGTQCMHTQADGERIPYTLDLSNKSIQFTFSAKNGTLQSTLSPMEDGTLRVDRSITTPRLTGAVQWSSTYRPMPTTPSVK